MISIALLSEMKRGRMGRREFLGRAAALGATSAAGLTLLGQVAQAQTPKRGGEVVWANGESSPAETFDPTKMTSGTDATRSYQVYNRLINLDRGLNPVPNLAVEWEGTNEAKDWAFKIRKGVLFHNGKTLTVEGHHLFAERAYQGRLDLGVQGPAVFYRGHEGRWRRRASHHA